MIVTDRLVYIRHPLDLLSKKREARGSKEKVDMTMEAEVRVMRKKEGS